MRRARETPMEDSQMWTDVMVDYRRAVGWWGARLLHVGACETYDEPRGSLQIPLDERKSAAG